MAIVSSRAVIHPISHGQFTDFRGFEMPEKQSTPRFTLTNGIQSRLRKIAWPFFMEPAGMIPIMTVLHGLVGVVEPAYVAPGVLRVNLLCRCELQLAHGRSLGGRARRHVRLRLRGLAFIAAMVSSSKAELEEAKARKTCIDRLMQANASTQSDVEDAEAALVPRKGGATSAIPCWQMPKLSFRIQR
jgi:hypothetical protein